MSEPLRYDNLRAFEKHIHSSAPNHLSNVYLFISKNSYDLAEANKILIDTIFPKGKYGEMDVRIFSYENLEMAKFLDEVNTLSFFSKKRIVILQNMDKLNANQLSILEEYIDTLNGQVILILAAESINKNTKFFKKIEKAGVILDIPEEKLWQKEKSMQVWLREKIARDGKQIDPQAIDFLIHQVGMNQNLLDQELFKLYCFLGERIYIKMEDIKAICSTCSSYTIWDLTDAIFNLIPQKALNAINALLFDGTSIIGILYQLRTQFQTQLQIASILTSSQSRDEITKHFPYIKGNILNKKINEVQNYGLNRLKKGLILINEYEFKAKNSGESSELLAELLVIHLSKK